MSELIDLTPELIRQRLIEELLASRHQARVLHKGVADYVNDPLGFIDSYVQFPGKQQLASYQREILTDLRDHYRVAVRGPRGLGKVRLRP